MKKKIFNDPIHGSIELHPLCVKIIDTPQFQRLRYLKQLGGVYFVFPGASHNRFEHSIGVCHLAGELARSLKLRQPNLNITEEEILCVEIAGLCHDLGHGAFSHLFDKNFIPAIKQNDETKPDAKEKWKHETASVDMFNHMLETNDGLERAFEDFILFQKERTLITELIKPGDLKDRGDRYFLYEIVANKKSGLDVDKWDYFARDCYHLGFKNNFDHLRLMKFTRVNDVKEDKQKYKRICYRDKEEHNIYDMFAVRARLHRQAYQHKTTIIIEHMICEALVEANKFLDFYGKDEETPMKLSETIGDMKAFTDVNDSIYYLILISRCKKLAPAREILKRIEHREIYKFIGKVRPNPKQSENIDEETKKLVNMVEDHKDITSDDVVIKTVYFDYGQGDENPVNSLYFYDKHDPDKAFPLRKDNQDLTRMLPAKFCEKIIYVYCKKDDKADIAKECFDKWREENFSEPPLTSESPTKRQKKE